MSRQFRSDDTDPWKYGFGNASDGDLTISGATTFGEANAGCSGSSGGTSLTIDSASSFANGDLVIIHQTRGTGAGSWELNKILSGGGTTSLTMMHNLQNTYTDSGSSQAQIVKLRQYNNVTVNSGITWSAPSWDGNKGGILAFLAKGTITITGTINGVGVGFRGGNSGGGTQYSCGEGTGGDRANQRTANGNGGGGAGHVSTPFQAGGAGGGHANAGSNGSAGSGSIGGSSVGNAGLTLLNLGGGGGAGWNNGSIGTGGNGSGIILIIGKSITVTGSINANGQPASGQSNFAGGSGAGGSILLKGQTITLGTNLVTSLGSSYGSNGGAGSIGRVHVDYKTSISGTSNPTMDTTQDLTLNDVSAGGSFLFNFI